MSEETPDTPRDKLVVTYTTANADRDAIRVYGVPTGLSPSGLTAYSVVVLCLALLDYEQHLEDYDPEAWREIVQRIADKDFSGALQYWQDKCREGTYLTTEFVSVVETPVDAAAVAVRAEELLR